VLHFLHSQQGRDAAVPFLISSAGQLTLFNLEAKIFEIFAITRLDELLTICREKPPTGTSEGA
jgi:hypothetical protein